MTERQPTKQFSPEVRQRAVRMVLEHRGEHASEWAAIGSIAARSAARRRRCAPGCARHGARRASTPAPARRSASGSARWNARCANRARPTRYCARHQRILLRRSSTAGSSHRRQRRRSGSARKPVPRASAGIAFIDDHRAAYGVEPICKVLPIAPSTYHAHAAHRSDPARASARARPRYGAVPRDPPRVRGALPRLWRAPGVAAARARGHHGRPLHGRAADAADGPAWRGPGPQHADHRPRPRRPLSARSCAAAVHAATAEAWDCPGLVDGSGAWLGRGSVDGSGLASYS